MKNYRPISLLTIFSKVLENIMYNICRLTTQLVPEVFFRKGIPTENVAIKLRDNIFKSMKEDYSVT
jgi:hypothetical protein